MILIYLKYDVIFKNIVRRGWKLESTLFLAFCASMFNEKNMKNLGHRYAWKFSISRELSSD